jgi:ABC-type branched-subunit amino acid transport system ATPase component/branched-subunit amino acid ABC-type transport system permease component
MDLLPFIIAGLTTGAIYGLSGVGLVLTYKTSGVFNFAHGSLATVSAFVFYSLTQQASVPWVPAALISVFLVGPIMGLLLERLARVLAGAALTTQVVGTVGILLIVESAVVLIYGSTTTTIVSPYLPAGGVRIGGIYVSASSMIIFAVGVVVTAGLSVYLRRARNGLAMRAVVDDPALLDLTGTSPARVRRSAWIVGSTLAALSGVLLAPLLPAIDGSTLALLIITAFGAAAIGGFTSLPGTFLGGLVIGVAEALISKYFTSTSAWGGLANSVPFIALFVVLLFTPRRRRGRPVRVRSQRGIGTPAPLALQLLGAAAILVFLCLVPSFAGIYLVGWMTFLTNIILFLSLGLLVRTAGQVSLCQVGFAAIGVTAFSDFAVGHHIPWLLALVLSGIVVIPIGAILAIPAIRLNGLYLALATLGFGLVLNDLFYGQPFMFGDVTAAVIVPRPSLSWLNLQSDTGYYYLLVAFVVLTAVLIVALNRSRLGRLLGALASSPTGLTASGASVNVTWVLVFCISAFLAAVAGALGGATAGVVSADSYTPLVSLTYFAVVVITIGREPWYAVYAAAGYTLIPLKWSGENVTNWLTLAFGVTALVYTFVGPDVRTPAAVRALFDWVRRRTTLRRRRAASDSAPAKPTPLHVEGADEAPIGHVVETDFGLAARHELSAADVVVRFGGVVAVRDVSINVAPGQIVGLIGPNGAGKTTTLNVLSGLVRPERATIRLGTRAVDRLGTPARARLGMGRTFQQMQLCDDFTVRANVALGYEAGLAGTNPVTHIIPGWQDRPRIAAASTHAMTACGIDELADRVVATLSTPERRLVELARCLAGRFTILLLDEPSSGLDEAETEQFGRLLREIVRTRGVGILLIEHDMSLVTAICDYVHVLDFGEQIFAGSPREVLAAPVVQQAYLGMASGPAESPEVTPS